MTTSIPSILDTLFRRHVGEVLSLAKRRVGAQEAEDVVQEAFLRILHHTDLSAVEDPRAYLYRVTARTAIDHGMHLKKQANALEPEVDPDAQHSPIPGPEAAALAASELRGYLAALDELPAIYRHVFLLHRLDGLPHAEIAQALGLSQRTVERYVAKALAHCAKRIGRARE